MDPKVCYTEMVEHYLNNEIDEAKERAETLLHWFSIGGFVPWITHQNYRQNCIEIKRMVNLIAALEPQELG